MHRKIFMTMEYERQKIVDKLLSGSYNFEEMAFEIYYFQLKNNPVYQEFCRHLGSPKHPGQLSEIPFLPVRFFKTHPIQTGDFSPAMIFKSSGTTDTGRSRHIVRSRKIYDIVSTRIFESAYEDLDEFILLALLPSYMEQGDSSLIYMIRRFMIQTGNSESQFYRYDFDQLAKDLQNYFAGSKKIILWGVTYALLDFAEKHQFDMKDHIVMETGGMKGRRKELIREEVHSILKENLHCEKIHSEYGMTELLSQCYSSGEGIFQMSASMKILSFDITDPLTILPDGQSGRCHVIDLANMDSCSFIATDDVCRTYGEEFEILGRTDSADVRGCNLMYL